ncbi:MAG: beta-1,6-N-acetylglucosaminyltransferase [Verrucomicrobiota bacterium]
MQDSTIKIGYLILAHNNCGQIARMVRILKQGNSRIVLHLDGSVRGQKRSDFLSHVRTGGEFEEARAVTCQWADWSLVAATLSGIEKFRDGGDPVSHVVLLSGSHFPIRPPGELEIFLDRNSGLDFIETCDAQENRWVKDGPNLERFQYFYPLNFRGERRGFDVLLSLQKKMGVKRSLPDKLRPHLGSQWWCLRFSTCDRIFEFLKGHPRVKRYFKSTWIPDESFFQTLVANLIDEEEVANMPFVLHALTPRGRPYVFHNDHEPFLVGKRHHFFARKVSPQAETLFQALEDRISRSDDRANIATNPALLDAENAKFSSKVESYYPLGKPLPGYLHDNCRELYLAIEQPVFVILGHNLSDSRLEQLTESLNSILDIQFLGRPFRKDIVEFTGVMEELGLGEKSFEIRDRYTCQLFYEFFSRRKNGIAFLVDPDQDFESWMSFSHLQNYFPICLTNESGSADPSYKQIASKKRETGSFDSTKVQIMGDMQVAPYIRNLCSMDFPRTLRSCEIGTGRPDFVATAQKKESSIEGADYDCVGIDKRSFVILAYARSGSYLLVDLLNQIQGVRCHGEIFKKARIELDEDILEKLPLDLKQRNEQELEYLSRVIELSGEGTVGFKLLASQNTTVENHVIHSDKIAKIILRRNTFDMYISLQRAKVTGVWIDKGHRQYPEDPTFRFDVGTFDRELQWHYDYYSRLESYALDRPDQFLLVDFEEVIDKVAFDKICPFLGLVKPASDSLKINLKKQTIEPIEKLVTNYEEMAKHIRNHHPNLFVALKGRVNSHWL